MNNFGKNETDERSERKKDDRNDLIKNVCSLLSLEKVCEDPDKRKIVEELVEEKLDLVLDKLSDVYMLRVHTFMDCLAEFSKMTTDYKNGYVQNVIALLYRDYCDLIKSRGMQELYARKICMVSMMTLPLGGKNSICELKHEEYGKQACDFIVRALTHFSGYEPENAVWKEIMMSSVPVNKKGLS